MKSRGLGDVYKRQHPTQTGADPQAEYVAAGTSSTGGGFWAGLAIGVGVMALIGGCVLFAAAMSLLRKAEQGKGQ